jgi:GAF domain-containing protein
MDLQSTRNEIAETVLALTDTGATDDEPAGRLRVLALASTDLLAVDAAVVFLLDGHGRLRPAAANPADTDQIDQLQGRCRPGPCEDCVHAGSPVSCSDLTRDSPPWEDFARGARAGGFRAVHAVPLARGSEVLGCLVVLRRVAGPLTQADQTSARHLAAAAACGIVRHRVLQGLLAENAQLEGALQSRITIEQAKGCLIGRHGLSPDEAFVSLRQYARSHRTCIRDVAQAVIDGRLDPARTIPTRTWPVRGCS